MSEYAEEVIEEVVQLLKDRGFLDSIKDLETMYQGMIGELETKNRNLRDRNTRLNRELKKHIDLLKPKSNIGVGDPDES